MYICTRFAYGACEAVQSKFEEVQWLRRCFRGVAEHSESDFVFWSAQSSKVQQNTVFPSAQSSKVQQHTVFCDRPVEQSAAKRYVSERPLEQSAAKCSVFKRPVILEQPIRVPSASRRGFVDRCSVFECVVEQITGFQSRVYTRAYYSIYIY